MVDIVARQFAREVAFNMQMQKVVSTNPLRINFRCPICGDSHKDKYKARGWFYEYKNEMRFGCFNCNMNMTFLYYLKEYNPEKFREYLLEKRKDNPATKHSEEVDVTQFKKVMPTIKESVIEKYAVRLDNLSDEHPAKKYMLLRMIPRDKLNLFWFTMKWRELSNEVSEGTYKSIVDEPRIVIPIFNKDGTISAMQGRALRKTETLRYLTIKAGEDANKVFGMERIDESKNVIFLEGPIDSVFVDNATAIVGGTMTLKEAPFPNKRAWLLDNEPRSVDTCKRIKKLIESGEKVVLWDRSPWSSKDVNDMIIKEGATIEEINDYIQSNIVSGLMAKMRFNDWIKCKIGY